MALLSFKSKCKLSFPRAARFRFDEPNSQFACFGYTRLQRSGAQKFLSSKTLLKSLYASFIVISCAWGKGKAIMLSSLVSSLHKFT